MHYVITGLEAIAGLIVFLCAWAMAYGPSRRRRDRRPVYHACTAGHRHQTPAAAAACSRAQVRL